MSAEDLMADLAAIHEQEKTMTQDNLATNTDDWGGNNISGIDTEIRDKGIAFLDGLAALHNELSMHDNCADDAGSHYRYEYNGIKLDPFRIASIYGMKDFALMTILKKCLCAGQRGHKDKRQDLLDIICAAQRAIEIIDEDEKQ